MNIVNWFAAALLIFLVGGVIVAGVGELVMDKYRERKNNIAFRAWMEGHAAASPPRREDSEKDYSGDRGSAPALD